MDVNDEEFIKAIEEEHDALGLWSLFLELGSMLLFLIVFGIALSFIPELKEPSLLLSATLFVIVCAIAWGVKALLDNTLIKIAYIRAYEKYQPTDKMSDWYESFHVFFEATHGREPTCEELDEALESWQENKNNPQH